MGLTGLGQRTTRRRAGDDTTAVKRIRGVQAFKHDRIPFDYQQFILGIDNEVNNGMLLSELIFCCYNAMKV